MVAPLPNLTNLKFNVSLFCFLAKKFAEIQPKKDTPAKKEKAAKESKPQEKKEKKEKKKEEKKPAPEDDDMDASEAALAAEPKAKDPFGHLPKRYKHFDAFFFSGRCLRRLDLDTF